MVTGYKIVLPEVIIIDGGRGHFNSAKKILEKYNLDTIKLLSVSKGKKRNAGREIIHTLKNNISLNPDHSLLYFLQRIRDEAHRFAITSHRSRRNKSSVKSVFEQIDGIGPKRKKMLINHFGSIEKIKNAKLNDLKKVNNLSKKIANNIYNFFNK